MARSAGMATLEGPAASPDGPSAWSRLSWEGDRMLLDGQAFRIEEVGAVPPTRPGELRFFKSRSLVERVAQFFARRPDFRPRRILEMGIWEGGSVAFWNQIFTPERHVAFDLATRGDSAAFRAWVDRSARRGSIETIWGIDQSDRRAVLDLARRTLGGAPDLVIDDAAHILECLQPAFETLFPLLAPGGIYLIEDWSWGHREEFQGGVQVWQPYGDPTRLILDLVETSGTSGGVVAAVHVDPDWVAVERGPEAIAAPLDFRLADRIRRRPAL